MNQLFSFHSTFFVLTCEVMFLWTVFKHKVLFAEWLKLVLIVSQACTMEVSTRQSFYRVPTLFACNV